MDWKKVAEDLHEQGEEAVRHAEALRSVLEPAAVLRGDALMIERAKTIERHRLWADFCFGLARALEAGLR